MVQNRQIKILSTYQAWGFTYVSKWFKERAKSSKNPNKISQLQLKPRALKVSVWSCHRFITTLATEAEAVTTMKPAVLQLVPTFDMLRSKLELKFQFYALWEQQDREAFLTEKGPLIRGLVATGAGAVPVTESLVSLLPNLELVITFGVGYDFVDTQPLKSRGVALANVPDVLTDTVAESAILLLLGAMRTVVRGDRFVREGRWSKEKHGKRALGLATQLSKKRVGIVGLGRIGAAIARRLEAFSCSIGYWGRSAKPQFPDYKFYEHLVDLARHSDVLIASCALTDGTRKVVNREVLDALGPQGFVVNIARGAVFDEAELVKALVEKRIAGAGLDVFEKEPNVPEELFELSNVLLQPHLAASTFEAISDLTDAVITNLDAQFGGKPLLTPVSI